ncbi:hypothetical protein DTO063F5_1952 [Paecilomyces variotii]|nr:hypothetical protein DTO063F5_1952 [Paecilomyces variotii]
MTSAPISDASHNAAAYYASFSSRPGLGQKFNDIDQAAHFRDYQRRLEDISTENFVLDFGNDDAWCAVNLDTVDFEALLEKPKPKCFGTRWINIWAPEKQKESIRLITNKYGVSERLQGLMCTEPASQSLRPAPGSEAADSTRHWAFSRQPDRSHPKDLEGAYTLKELVDPDTIREQAASLNLTFSDIINQIWHFSSVDYGPKYTCVGYNSLYTIPGIDTKNDRGLPTGKRLWTWIILFNDGTVVSIQENPFPGTYIPSPEEISIVLSTIRRNFGFIFSGVSKQHSIASANDSLVTIRIRHFSNSQPDDGNISQEDGSSLLFYYIFDDWVTSYRLVARREHKYGAYLDDLREQMLDKPDVDLVSELHWLGRRLAVLKRLYQSYETIITRILQRQRVLRDEAHSHPNAFLTGSNISDGDPQDWLHLPPGNGLNIASGIDAPPGVLLSSAAVGRFQRLIDRIRLFCLSEIDTCLTEKESLTFLNFNLIALKDSQAVEKLTRITILLAKATMLFMPVSLMTAYFSTQIDDLQGVYTARTYWVSFGVIMVLTIIALAVFGFASDTVEGKTIYRSLLRTFVDSSRNKLSTQKKGRYRE